MASFMLLLHENPQAFKGLSAAEMQAIIERYGAWANALAAKGALAGGEKLKDEGGYRLKKGAGGVVASMGPYAEAADIVSGYFMIKAADYAEAQRLCADSPHFDFGWIELREVDPIEG
jgi:hypothetical protein